MNVSQRALLLQHLRKHVEKIASDLRAKMRTPGQARERAALLHQDERVGEDFEVWTDLLSRRAAVLWVLKSVYARVLEDRGFLGSGRLLDRESQDLFERLAPNLGETAFLKWIYRDLASADGGLPELFGTQPAEVALPSDEHSRALLDFWRHKDADTGARFSFGDEHFEGELMGDLYQELDPLVKERFALCQTPDFVRAFILDRTLSPAIEKFGADRVRVLDPACGSGHFLIDAFKRLVSATAAGHPDWEREKVGRDVLERVVGIDLNDYACGLARARLLMTAAEMCGIKSLAGASNIHPHVYWGDGLEQVERAEPKKAEQVDLFGGLGGLGKEKREERARASLTRSDVRVALQKVFGKKFHAVVANPPYIVERDEARKDYHREMIGKNRRYVSAAGKYSLGSPFTERCFQLAEPEGFVGIITSNNFMKREFGKPLIEKVLAGLDLTLVVDTSQAYIPHHGTPTVLLFGRNRRPKGPTIRAVMGKRGESGTPAEPAKGKVWSSIVEGWDKLGFENEYVSVAEVTRETLGKHPWSLGGGGAAELKERVEACTHSTLGNVSESIGITCFTLEDEAFLNDPSVLQRHGISQEYRRPMVEGEAIRDWAVSAGNEVVFPYDQELNILSEISGTSVERWLLPFKTRLSNNKMFGGRTKLEDGLKWYEFGRFTSTKLRTPLSIAFAFVATHNHFVLDRGAKVFNRSAPVIKLPAGSTEDEHLALLGLLNSSLACFWMKQVFHAKGGVDRCQVEAWDMHFEFDSTKMKIFPIAAQHKDTIPHAKTLDQLARQRADRSPASVLASMDTNTTAASLRKQLDARREQDTQDLFLMVALQEELDWLCYKLYGLDDGNDCVPPEQVEALAPTCLPWCLNFAQRDAKNREALAQGQTPPELPSVWFERHRWEALSQLPPEMSPAQKKRIEARRERIQKNPALSLIESPNFKRRWYKPDYDAEEQDAFGMWLASRVEQAAKERAKPFSLEQICAALQDDPQVLAVCEVMSGRKDFSLLALVAESLAGDSVPNHPFHLYKESGLDKFRAWERTWEEQRREDAGEPIKPSVPPSYGSGDFLKPEYWQLRGKLDVPKERFIAFSEIPSKKTQAETLYGWAGWTALQRIKHMLAMDEELEDNGLGLGDRIALLDSAWRLLPDAAREDASVAARLKAELQALTSPEGPSKSMLLEWQKQNPPPQSRAGKQKRAERRREGEEI